MFHLNVLLFHSKLMGYAVSMECITINHINSAHSSSPTKNTLKCVLCTWVKRFRLRKIWRYCYGLLTKLKFILNWSSEKKSFAVKRRLTVALFQNPTIFNIKRWFAGSIISSTKRLMVQVLFWILQKNYEKNNNNWNIRHLVNEMIVPMTQRPSVLYWRLSDL